LNCGDAQVANDGRKPRISLWQSAPPRVECRGYLRELLIRVGRTPEFGIDHPRSLR
jgi:hypothetical protein